VSEGREQTPDDEDAGDGVPVPDEVADVLGEGEASRDDGGVDEPVDGPVEGTSPDEEDDEDAEALGGLLDERRRDHCRDLEGPLQAECGLGRGVEHRGVDQHGDGGGHTGSPQEGDDKSREWLGLPAVDPEDDGEHEP